MAPAHASRRYPRRVSAFILFSFFWVSISLSCAARVPHSREMLEVKKHLKRINKKPIKTILSPDGDIIDCVRTSDQPAFDHPFHKDHTPQMRPSIQPEELFGESSQSTTISEVEGRTNPFKQPWHSYGNCPDGTIPIRRTKKEEVLRANSIKSFGRKRPQSLIRHQNLDPQPMSENGHQHAIVYVEGDKYYGAKATMNVWNPKIQQSNEFSLSQIWVLSGNFGQDLNSIEAGWQVSPDLYGDNNTRLFTYWTSDAYQATGCYNLLCSGFIQINNRIAMGAAISPISAFQASQFDISILIWKDPKQGHWWMQFGSGLVLGYWPSYLFSNLGDSASMIEWGGEVVNSNQGDQHTTTEMGSGHFPDQGFGKASYFRNIQVVDGTNKLKAPDGIGIFSEQPNCYNVITGNKGDWGRYIYYGGPGRNLNCP